MSGRTERCVDEEGRITIPQSIRESLHIEPGDAVEVERDDGRVVIKPRLAREATVETIADTPTDEANVDDVTTLDPTARSDWTSDLP
jgi:AbrB family looped-hinge helix DNA binding protein